MFLSWNHGSAARMNKGKSAVLYHYSIPKKQIQLKADARKIFAMLLNYYELSPGNEYFPPGRTEL